MIIEAPSSHQPIASSARANSLELELSADPPGFGAHHSHCATRVRAVAPRTRRRRQRSRNRPILRFGSTRPSPPRIQRRMPRLGSRRSSSRVELAPAPAPAEAAVMEEPPPSVDASSTRDIEMSAAGDSLPRLGAVPSRSPSGAVARAHAPSSRVASRPAPPIFFVGSLLALVSCSLIQATAPCP